ncbi:MAG: SOS response-associated peptidase [Pseudomonadota bacterium]
MIFMCGRLDQHHSSQDYAMPFAWYDAVYDSHAEPRYNVAPGTYRPVIHVENEVLRVDDLYWGYRPHWAAAKKIPVAINARMEKLSKAYFGRLLKNGRCIVPADAWYEWTGEKGRKQPWRIYRKDQQPLFIAALANFGPYKEQPEHPSEAGFVLITADAVGGMVDIHDRRPVVLNLPDATLWLDPDLAPEQAEQLLRHCASSAEEFAWYPVSRDVNKGSTDDRSLIKKLDD